MRMLKRQDGPESEIASLQGKDRFERQNEIQEMLIAHISTPHRATRITPYFKSNERSNSEDHVGPDIDPGMQASEKNDIKQKDAEYKQRIKQHKEGTNTREGRLLLGDYVLVKQLKTVAFLPFSH